VVEAEICSSERVGHQCVDEVDLDKIFSVSCLFFLINQLSPERSRQTLIGQKVVSRHRHLLLAMIIGHVALFLAYFHIATRHKKSLMHVFHFFHNIAYQDAMICGFLSGPIQSNSTIPISQCCRD